MLEKIQCSVKEELQSARCYSSHLISILNTKKHRKIIKKTINCLTKKRGSRQMVLSMEELQELNIELLKFSCNIEEDKSHIAEEIADVLISIMFLKVCLKFETSEVLHIIPSKKGYRLIDALRAKDNSYAIHLSMYIFSNMTKSISKVLRGKENKDFLLQYIHDTELAIYAVSEIFSISPCSIEHWLESKLNRQNHRNKSNTNI